MTDCSCWVTYRNDRELQKKVADGWFTENGHTYLPLDDFPPPPMNRPYWPTLLERWCEKTGLDLKQVDALTVSVSVNRSQIEDFIEFVYGNDPSYCEPAKMLTWEGRAYLANRLTDLRAFVAQQLDSTVSYELNADEL